MIISKMYSSLAENHATQGGAADGRMPLLQPSSPSTYSSSHTVLCTHWKSIFVLPFSMLLCAPGVGRCPKKQKENPYCLVAEPSKACSHSNSNQTVHWSFLPKHCIFSVVLVSFTVLFLHMSTVSRSVSGPRSKAGMGTNFIFYSGIVVNQRAM